MFTPTDKKYIDTAVTKKIAKAIDASEARITTSLHASLHHEIGLLQDFWRHEFALVVEMIKDKPGREEVREITKDELRHHGLQR